MINELHFLSKRSCLDKIYFSSNQRDLLIVYLSYIKSINLYDKPTVNCLKLVVLLTINIFSKHRLRVSFL